MSLKRKILASYFVVFITVVFVIFYYNKSEKHTFVCGTPDIVDHEFLKLTDNQIEGRKLFKALCNSCHKLDKLGPPMISLMNYKKSSEQFYFDIVNNKRHFDFSYLSKNEISKVLEFVKFEALKRKNASLEGSMTK